MFTAHGAARRVRRGVLLGAALTLIGSAAAGCSSESGSAGAVEISYLVANDPTGVESAERLLAAFEEKHPDIAVTLQTQPDGTEGDNLTKTKLATGDPLTATIGAHKSLSSTSAAESFRRHKHRPASRPRPPVSLG